MSKLANLTTYKPIPSPFKKKFQDLGLSAAAVSSYIGRSYPHSVNMLNGISPIPAKIEEKMKELIEKVKADRMHQDSGRLDEAGLG